MGWGAPLGFSSGPSPFETANTASHGEPGHYFTLRWMPTDEHPLRAVVGFPCGRATFHSAEDAHAYLAHPGDTPHAARYYLAAMMEAAA